jgi:hypothetical protein
VGRGKARTLEIERAQDEEEASGCGRQDNYEL